MAANNDDPKRTIESPIKPILASLSTWLSIWLISSHWLFFSEFAKRHPGLIGVLIAVTGEVFFDWKELKADKHSRWKKFFMMLLVLSLAYELRESAGEDKDVGDSNKKAGDANERAALANERSKSNEVQLASLNQATLKLAAQYDLSTNALAEANARLATIKPLKERIIDLLNLIDPKLVGMVRNGNVQPVKTVLPVGMVGDLERLAHEPGGSKYISVPTSEAFGVYGGGTAAQTVRFEIFPALLK